MKDQRMREHGIEIRMRRLTNEFQHQEVPNRGRPQNQKDSGPKTPQ